MFLKVWYFSYKVKCWVARMERWVNLWSFLQTFKNIICFIQLLNLFGIIFSIQLNRPDAENSVDLASVIISNVSSVNCIFIIWEIVMSDSDMQYWGWTITIKIISFLRQLFNWHILKDSASTQSNKPPVFFVNLFPL